ncbi:MAG: hypothetical protein PVF96_00785 [Candidatus Bathyarchaeota archaeon]
MKKNGVILFGFALIVVLMAIGWLHLLRAAPDETFVMAIIEDTNGDRIGVEPTSSDVWDEFIELYHSKEVMLIGGPVEVFIFIRPDPNYPWGFRFKPENVTVAENTAEGLQTTIRGISEDAEYWIRLGQAYVFAKVVEIHERVETSDIIGPDGYPDGKVDMRDIGFAARNFGRTVPPAPLACDITGLRIGIPDGIIDMRDVGTIARHFGKIGS